MQEGAHDTRMEKHLVSLSTPACTDLSVQVFVDPTLLPVGMQLLLDVETRTALLLAFEEGTSPCLFRTFPLTPSAAQIFLVLLQAYPDHCTHRALFHALYPGGESKGEQAWERERDLALPLVRRALKSLLPTLRGCGLRAVSLRSQGYVLARIPQAQSQ
jgi:hypothetical protein